MKISILPLILSFCFIPPLKAQLNSAALTRKKNREIAISIAVRTPLVFMGIGILALTDTDYIGRQDIYEDRNENFPRFKTHVDDYLQYAPIAGVLTLNALGVKGQNTFANQMWLLAKSELLMTAIAFPLKKITAVPRPDSGAPNSFPSGHTAQAFVAATFLHKEYGKTNPIYSVLAYGTATSVAVLRMMNNRHWSTDIFFGAGIGILSTNLVYLLHDNKKRNRKVFAVPTYQNGNFGIDAIIPLN